METKDVLYRKKQYSRVSILDMIIMAAKGFGISLIITFIVLMVVDKSYRYNDTFLKL